MYSEDNLYWDTTVANSSDNFIMINNQDNGGNNINNKDNNIDIGNKQSEQLENASSFRTPLSLVNTILSTNSATITSSSECTENTEINPLTEEEKLQNENLRKI
eukprot:Pgem_evm2s8767